MKKKTIVNGVAVIILIAAIAIIVSMFTDSAYEKTDDAQIEQYISPINVKVPGYIREIRFTENQKVKKGDTLMVIDDREYRIALKQAQAAVMDARSGRKAAGNSLNTATNSATVYDASIEEAELRVAKLERDYARYSRLLEKKAATPVTVEQYKTELDMARARVVAMRRQREAARSSVSEVSQRQHNAEAAVLRAEAALEMAELNLSYTVITAPADGWLGRRNIETGQLVNPGQTITTIVPDNRKWVVANFKETQIGRIREGQSVEIAIDALPGHVFRGTVTSLSPATGSKYSMIPVDNAAGNFVKIQQRIPVRIDFDEPIGTDAAAGMMCVVKVDVKRDSHD